jgi:hypothetical protein
VRIAPLTLLILATACRQSPKPAELAAYLPANASIIAGVNVDALRNTSVFPKLPENFREASYVMAALDPPNLVTASIVQGRIQATTPKSAPPDLAKHAADAPIWLAVKGTAALPLTGNWSNVNRLIGQTDYTVISVRLKEKAEFTADGVCRTPEAANHLDQNIRAIATLTKLPIQTRTVGTTVRLTGEAPVETVLRLLH